MGWVRRRINSSFELDRVETTTTSEGLIHMVTVGRATCIVFSNDDLPLDGLGHTRPLYISVSSSGRQVPSILLDNGATLNGCSLGTAIAISCAPSNFGPSTQTVRAYDNTKRKVMGTLEIELLIGPTTFITVFQTLEMEDFCRDFVAMPFDQHGSTVVLDMMKSMSYLPEMGLGRRQHGPSEFMTILDHDVPFRLKFIPTEADYRYMVRLRKERLSDGAPRTSASALTASSSPDRMSLMTLYFPDEIDEHGTFAEIENIVDGVVPRDEYIVEEIPTTPAPESIEDVLDVDDLFNDPIGLVEGASEFVDPPFSFDMLLGFVSRSDDVHDSSFMDLSIFEYLPLRELRIGLDLSTNEKDGLARLLRLYLDVKEEIQKQLSVGFCSIVEYPEWLANIVLVPKKDDKVRVCVDFRNRNKASLKDDFSFPHIDMLIDSTTGHSMLSFMNGFFGYSQILMASEDMEKTSFITEWGTYYYRVIPFGLKNVGATYQRVATTLFHDMMHRDVEVYVDDMIVKS
ncbi:hypothetical protein AAG906_007791 [Vitis piasezkii]